MSVTVDFFVCNSEMQICEEKLPFMYSLIHSVSTFCLLLAGGFSVICAVYGHSGGKTPPRPPPLRTYQLTLSATDGFYTHISKCSEKSQN